jgi:signal transduction histidine kinase
MLSCDVELLNRACVAVLDNAVRASEKHIEKITIQIEEKTISHTSGSCELILIKIIDRGPGIPEEFLPQVFNPFFTTYKVRGHSGLGLSIAQKIIEAHGGTISISNNDKYGVTVTLILPEADEYEKEI